MGKRKKARKQTQGNDKTKMAEGGGGGGGSAVGACKISCTRCAISMTTLIDSDL
jgi:hypothetical protein